MPPAAESSTAPSRDPSPSHVWGLQALRVPGSLSFSQSRKQRGCSCSTQSWHVPGAKCRALAWGSAGSLASAKAGLGCFVLLYLIFDFDLMTSEALNLA